MSRSDVHQVWRRSPPPSGPKPGTPVSRIDPRVAWRFAKGLSGLLLIIAMVGGVHWLLRLESAYLPVRVVSIQGDVRRMTLQQIQERVGRTLEAGILTQDLATIQAAIRDLPWVSDAGVRRTWPDRLVISVQEHQPLARWGEDGLVTAEGVVFRPERHEFPQGLVRLAGPDDQAAEVVRRFQAWQSLLKPLGLGILALEDDPRGAWTLVPDAGFTLLLGKSDVEERLDRFLKAYPAILAAGRPARVDVRYSNGLAVSWSGARVAGQPSPQPSSLAQSDPPAKGPAQAGQPLPPSGSPAAVGRPSRS